MATITHDGLLVCSDCAMLIANAEETSPEHSEALAARWPGQGLVLTCGEECDEGFVTRPCDGCGSPLAGDRHAAVAFGPES